MREAFRFGGIAAVLLLTGWSWGHSTVVRFSTTLGDFEVALFDSDTPITVANFLSYVESGAYTTNLFFHRSVPGFVLQGGGFYILSNTVFAVPTQPAITNEPGISNLRGTIAMAKVGDNPNSATSQWFFNLGDNSANLNNQNGGFTVFGRVIGEGMQVVDALAAVPTYDASITLGGAFTQLPLLNPSLQTTNLLYIRSLSVVPFQFKDVLPVGDNIRIEWDGPAAGVELEQTTSLINPNWTVISPTNQTGFFETPQTNGPFFRLTIP
jgi:peptidyl-prolyl cis-trans isomerase A (cyclophilin A)